MGCEERSDALPSTSAITEETSSTTLHQNSTIHAFRVSVRHVELHEVCLCSFMDQIEKKFSAQYEVLNPQSFGLLVVGSFDGRLWVATSAQPLRSWGSTNRTESDVVRHENPSSLLRSSSYELTDPSANFEYQIPSRDSLGARYLSIEVFLVPWAQVRSNVVERGGGRHLGTELDGKVKEDGSVEKEDVSCLVSQYAPRLTLATTRVDLQTLAMGPREQRLQLYHHFLSESGTIRTERVALFQCHVEMENLSTCTMLLEDVCFVGCAFPPRDVGQSSFTLSLKVCITMRERTGRLYQHVLASSPLVNPKVPQWSIGEVPSLTTTCALRDLMDAKIRCSLMLLPSGLPIQPSASYDRTGKLCSAVELGSLVLTLGSLIRAHTNQSVKFESTFQCVDTDSVRAALSELLDHTIRCEEGILESYPNISVTERLGLRQARIVGHVHLKGLPDCAQMPVGYNTERGVVKGFPLVASLPTPLRFAITSEASSADTTLHSVTPHQSQPVPPEPEPSKPKEVHFQQEVPQWILLQREAPVMEQRASMTTNPSSRSDTYHTSRRLSASVHPRNRIHDVTNPRLQLLLDAQDRTLRILRTIQDQQQRVEEEHQGAQAALTRRRVELKSRLQSLIEAARKPSVSEIISTTRQRGKATCRPASCLISSPSREGGAAGAPVAPTALPPSTNRITPTDTARGTRPRSAKSRSTLDTSLNGTGTLLDTSHLGMLSSHRSPSRSRILSGSETTSSRTSTSTSMTMIDEEALSVLMRVCNDSERYSAAQIHQFLERFPNFRMRSGGFGPLHALSRNGHGMNAVEMMAVVLNVGIHSILARDARGRTPLHHACASPHVSLDILHYLVTKGAPLDATDELGETPFHTLCRNLEDHGHQAKKFFLSRTSVTVDQPTEDGRTALHLLAGDNAYHDTIRFLVEHGANVSREVPFLRATPAHIALHGGSRSYLNYQYLTEH